MPPARTEDFLGVSFLRTCHTRAVFVRGAPLSLVLTLFFWFRFKYITIEPICHMTVKDCNILQSRIFLHPFLSLWCSFDRAPQSSSALSFANQSAVSFPSMANLSTRVSFVFSFWCRCAFTCFTSNKSAFLWLLDRCTSSHHDAAIQDCLCFFCESPLQNVSAFLIVFCISILASMGPKNPYIGSRSPS